MTTLHTGFLDENSRSVYPFRLGSTLADASNNVMSSAFITDAGLSIPFDYNKPHLSSFYLGRNIVSMAIASGNTQLLVGSKVYSNLSAVSNTTIQLQPLVPGVSGYVRLGRFEEEDVPRQHRFEDNSTTLFSASTVHWSRPMPVNKFFVGTPGSRYIRQAQGDVKLVGQGDMSVTTEPSSSYAVVRLEVNRDRSDYLSNCDKTSSTTSVEKPIRRINGVLPNSEGVLTIRIKSVQGEDDAAN